MAVEQNVIVERVEVEDATGPGARSAVASMERVAGASDRMGDTVRGSSSAFRYFDKAAASSASALNRLRGQADPTYAAMQRLERAERDLDRALRQGLTTEEEKIRLLDQLSFRYGATAAANQNMLGVQRAATAGTKQFGLAAQNAAFQVGDFATQIASGQNPIRAMSQQLPQLLGGFGVFGAVAGAAVAIGGALAMSFLDQEEAADRAADATETYAESVKAAASFVDGINESLETQEESYRRVARSALEGARLEVQAAEARVEAQMRVAQSGGQMRRAARDRVADAQADLAEAQANLDALQGDIDAAIATANFASLQSKAEAVVDGLLPATAAARKFEEQQATLNAAVAAGAITQDDYTAALAAAEAQHAAVVGTFETLLAGYQEERDLLTLSNAERAVQVKLEAELNKLREAGFALTEAGIDRLEQEIRLNEQLKRDRAGAEFLEDRERGVELLRLRLVLGEDEVEILEDQARLRDKLGRDLLPAEAASVRRLAEDHRRLTAEIEASADAEARLMKALEPAIDMPDEVAGEFIEAIEEIIR